MIYLSASLATILLKPAFTETQLNDLIAYAIVQDAGKRLITYQADAIQGVGSSTLDLQLQQSTEQADFMRVKAKVREMREPPRKRRRQKNYRAYRYSFK